MCSELRVAGARDKQGQVASKGTLYHLPRLFPRWYNPLYNPLDGNFHMPQPAVSVLIPKSYFVQMMGESTILMKLTETIVRTP